MKYDIYVHHEAPSLNTCDLATAGRCDARWRIRMGLGQRK